MTIAHPRSASGRPIKAPTALFRRLRGGRHIAGAAIGGRAVARPGAGKCLLRRNGGPAGSHWGGNPPLGRGAADRRHACRAISGGTWDPDELPRAAPPPSNAAWAEALHPLSAGADRGRSGRDGPCRGAQDLPRHAEPAPRRSGGAKMRSRALRPRVGASRRRRPDTGSSPKESRPRSPQRRCSAFPAGRPWARSGSG
jgi:hypothetical protein